MVSTKFSSHNLPLNPLTTNYLRIRQVTSEAQLDEARLSVERNVMGRIYSSAVYPNGDGDVMRDEVLSDHVKRVSKNLTPDCADLSIPRVS